MLRGGRLKKNAHCTKYQSFQTAEILALRCCKCQEAYMTVQVKGGDWTSLWNAKASKDKDLIFVSESPWDVTRHRENLWGNIATCLHTDFFIIFSSYLLLIMLKVGCLDRGTFVHPYALTQAMWTEKLWRFGNEPMTKVQWVVCHRSVLPRYFKSLLWSSSSGPYTWSSWHLLEHGDHWFPCGHEEWCMCSWLGMVPVMP